MNKSIIKNKEILEMEGEHKVHFLNPNAVRRNKSLGGYYRDKRFWFSYHRNRAWV
ncbi:hypothetical protein [Microbulbifer sp. THAF38]|uniref:hypothetical protein n=1 Tax=Microbulbifer sp. THAF38 TaxID=2587856 RepID=UPI0020A51ABA|nr:hypothetical protein [Microbulbifer sp. THAF38]